MGCSTIWATLAMSAAVLFADARALHAQEVSVSPPGIGKEPVTVDYLVYLADISEIRGREQSFDANFFIQLKWKDERLVGASQSLRTVELREIWHPRVVVLNQTEGIQTSFPEVASVAADGTVTYRQRYIGQLSQPLNLGDFPFDAHRLSIRFAAEGHSTQDISFRPGRFTGKQKRVGGAIADSLSLPDWTVEGFEITPEPVHVPGSGRSAAGFAFHFDATRHGIYYVWNLILPLVLIVMMSWIACWIDPTELRTQMGLGTSAVLTMIAYRFVLASLLPRLSYLTRLDRFTILSTLLVFLMVLKVAITIRYVKADKVDLARRIDRWFRIGFPVAYAGMLAWAFGF